MTEAVQKDQGTHKIALQMEDISKAFGPVQALAKVSFTVRRGTVHGLVGENGAGKSTLMKILSGAYRPDGGTIKIYGQLQHFKKPTQAIAAGVSMIYQDIDLAEDLSVAENIFLGNEPTRIVPFIVDRQAMIEQTKEIASKYGFDVDPFAIVSELPTGDCQIVEILKALARKSTIIVMDEPTSSLSEGEAARLFKAVKNLSKHGISIIYISHRLEEIIDLAEDITVLRDGNVVCSKQASEMDVDQIVHNMVGYELDEYFPKRNAKIGDTCLEVKDLSVKKKIKSISFKIRKGEIVGMAGLVGSGRTDVAEAIFGVGKIDTGSMYLDGKKLNITAPHDAICSRIALLTEDRKRTGLCVGLPCGWNVSLPNLEKMGMNLLVRPAREESIVRDIVSQMSIKWTGPESPANSLSGGNQQKLLIARWILAESKFMIFDEPTRGIDVGAKKEVYTLLNRLAEEGKAVLFISSELPELMGISDRILVMRRGKLVGDLVTKDTTQEQVMRLAASGE